MMSAIERQIIQMGENSYQLNKTNHEISIKYDRNYVIRSSNISVTENWNLLCCIFKDISEEIIYFIIRVCEMQWETEILQSPP
jgi:hypothetical protein